MDQGCGIVVFSVSFSPRWRIILYCIHVFQIELNLRHPYYCRLSHIPRGKGQRREPDRCYHAAGVLTIMRDQIDCYWRTVDGSSTRKQKISIFLVITIQGKILVQADGQKAYAAYKSCNDRTSSCTSFDVS